MKKVFKKIFRSSKSRPEVPKISFGRFSDSYKEDEKYDAWDRSLEIYEEGKYLESFRMFLLYLLDDQQNNVIIDDSEDGKLIFEIFQGSKKIRGYADENKVKAEAKIATAKELKIGFLRRLMELNFGLQYSRYAIDDDNNITMVFDTYMLDGSPYKLYYALKELAVNADKQDDILLNEFKVLRSINTGHLRDIDEHIKIIKFKFLQNSINSSLEELDTTKLNLDKYPGGVSYLLLDTVYKLDYLVKPEGFIMDIFESIHREYFRNDNKSPQLKNRKIVKQLKKVLARNKQEFFDELYGVKSTFGITAPTTHDRLVNFINGEIENMDWYEKNKYSRIALAVPGYIVGYCLFNYALPGPDKAFLHLYYNILEQPYFNNLGFSYDYVKEGSLNKSGILMEIDRIVKRFRKEYPKLKANKKNLNFKNKLKFARSFLLMIRDFDLERKTK